MGCDIHATAERRIGGKWEEIPNLYPFDWRSYGMFAFLADVRNYSAIRPLAKPRGIPADSPNYTGDDDGHHSHSWLSVEELISFDYDQPIEDRRVTVQVSPNYWNGGATAEPGGGKMTTFREFLGPAFFDELTKLLDAGAERVVFDFDS